MVSSVTACQGIIASSLRALVGSLAPSVSVVAEMTFESNEKFELNKVPKQLIISVSKGSKVVSIVNPLPQVAKQLVTVTVDSPIVAVSFPTIQFYMTFDLCPRPGQVTNASDVNVMCQVSPIWNNGGVSVDGYRLTFLVTIPPLGWAHYTLSQQEGVACTRATIQLLNTGPIERWGIDFVT